MPEPPDCPADHDLESSAPKRAEASEDEIRLRAYHRYLQRGGGLGLDFDDWLEVEREFKSST